MITSTDIQEKINEVKAGMMSLSPQKRRLVLKDLIKLIEIKPCSTDIFEVLHPTLTVSMNDTDETVRELTLDVLLKVPSCVFSNKCIDDIIPILLFRLGDQKTRESSEELRVKFVMLLAQIISVSSEYIGTYLDVIIQILCQTLLDPYAQVRRESTICCKYIATLSNHHAYDHTYKLVKPLLLTAKHHQFKVRMMAIDGLCEIMKNVNWKFVEPQEVFGTLGERLFDDTHSTRHAVVQLLGDWFLSLRDRYSFFSRMIPLMLTCLTDEQTKVSDDAWAKWEAAGRQYLDENERELKDKIDFLDGKLDHYPPNETRPNLGCRTLVQRNIGQILVPLLREIADWKPEIRVKSSNLLVMLILHAEQEITQHTDTVLRGMYVNAEKGTPAIVIENTEKAAEYMAHFISPSMWHQLIASAVEDEVKLGHLRIIAALFRGTRKRDLEKYEEQFIDLVIRPAVCFARNVMFQVYLLKCCDALINNIEVVEPVVVNKLFHCLFRVASVIDEPNLQLLCQDCLKRLGQKINLTVMELIAANINSLVNEIKSTSDCWTAVHADFPVLLYVLRQPASVWSSVQKDIEYLLKAATNPDMDAMAKSQVMSTLVIAVKCPLFAKDMGEENYPEFFKMIIEDVIIPNLTWRAGATAEVLRSVVLACLAEIISPLKNYSTAVSAVTETIPHLVSCLRDYSNSTRCLALRCLIEVIGVTAASEKLTLELWNNMYQEVLARLDDVDTEVRSQAVMCIKCAFLNLPHEYTEITHRPHLDNIAQVVLTHLADQDTTLQQDLLDNLTLIKKRAPTLIQEVVTRRRHLFQDQHLIDELLQKMQIDESASS